MIAIAIRYLNGWSSSTPLRNGEVPEWPPHPDRVFMALTAACFETESDAAEQAALQWLEQQPAPAMYASPATERNCQPVYVPVNGDRNNMKSLLKVMPDKRKRDKRYFPTILPDEDTVYLIWEVDMSAEHRPALERLCANVGYLGDTSSLVQMWVSDTAPAPTLIAVNDRALATERLRVPYAGRMEDLQADYARDVAAGEYRPRRFRYGDYAAPQPAPTPIHSSRFADLLIFRRVSGDRFDIRQMLDLTQAWRGALMKAWNDHVSPTIPNWLSGHTTEGQRIEDDHLAFLALPEVGYEHAEGELKGVALAVPHDLPRANLDECLKALFHTNEWGDSEAAELMMGRAGACIVLPDEQAKMHTLRPRTWIGPARVWASATPIVLDRYPKKDGDVEGIIARACERIGLPRPEKIDVMPASPFVGAPPARRMPTLPAKFGKTLDQHTHARLTFSEKVRGPVLLGAGRYRGYGLCRPVWEETA